MPQTIESKALLFDMDGVLVSSIASVNRCWRRWAEHYHVADADKFKVPHGTRAVEIIRILRPDLNEQQVAEGLTFIEDIEIADVHDTVVLPGVRELLASLPPDRWTIVTSATRRLMVARLRAAGLPIPDPMVTGSEVTHGKPHPEPYITGARLLGFAPEECIVVEDAPSGVGSGRAAGSRALGVLGTHAADDLRDAGAAWVVADLTQVQAEAAGHSLQIKLTGLDAVILA